MYAEEKGNTLAEGNGSQFKSSTGKMLAFAPIKKLSMAAINLTTESNQLDKTKLNLLSSLNGKLEINNKQQFSDYIKALSKAKQQDYAAKIAYLKSLDERTDAEQRELELCKAGLGKYANRIIDLGNKLELTLAEQFEKDLLFTNFDDKDHAARIAELLFKPEAACSKLELLEYSLLIDAKTRPYTYHIIDLLFKERDKLLTKVEEREFQIISKITTVDIAKKIAELESIESKMSGIKQGLAKKKAQKEVLNTVEKTLQDSPNLSYTNSEKLAKLYLKYLCNLDQYTLSDLDINYKSITFNPVTDCVRRDSLYNFEGTRNFALLRSVEAQFTAAANEIMLAKMKQDIPAQLKGRQLSQDIYDKCVERYNNPTKQKEIQTTVYLTLLKIFFDGALKESNKALHHQNIGTKLREVKKAILKSISEPSCFNTASIGTAEENITAIIGKEKLEEILKGEIQPNISLNFKR